MSNNQPQGNTYNRNNYNNNQSGNFGIGQMGGGEIQSGAKVAGILNEAQQHNLAEAAQEIKQLLEQLESDHNTSNTSGKMALAATAIEQIENNHSLKQRIVSALKAGGIGAFEQMLNHPAASFVIAAMDSWQENNS